MVTQHPFVSRYCTESLSVEGYTHTHLFDAIVNIGQALMCFGAGSFGDRRIDVFKIQVLQPRRITLQWFLFRNR
jgi:hypothetical protein